MQRATERLIVAFDSSQAQETLGLAKRLRGLIRYAKIGSILFTAVGPAIITRMRALGFEVFLDLKFHDIPSTVEKSCRAAVRHRVAMLTVHASGERRMLEAARAGVRDESKRLRIRRPRVVGVTVLTSAGTSSARNVTQRVIALARQAKRAGLDGVVCSAWEAAAVRRALGARFLIVCPGIRPAGASMADQRRVASAHEAIARGADVLVVGRPITGASDPRRVVEGLLEEIQRGRSCRC